jgi:histidine phosphotransferase ChpT
VRGGTLDIGAEIREGASEIVIRAAGKKIAFDPAIGRALDGSLDSEGLTTKTAPAVMIRDMAVGLGGGVQFALSEDALVMGAVLPVG